MNNIIFYFGSIVIILFFIYLSYIKFKDYPEIDIKEHKWIIFIYIILLVMAIIVWRMIYLIIEVNFFNVINYNTIIQRVNNG